ncbi:hypothetical protein HPB52_002645 [Rhipicephalus sanguineus]|uniref:Uncharacterized protein n=1 Tax=Rhipicephalus sanguineus TaxID=34632 RepID=A0A9D4PA47_RHISA|nr:hypothetical protein HPB52_002645 [Rhipicephalus sanguineus]
MAEAPSPPGTEQQQHPTSPPQHVEAHVDGQQPPMHPENTAQPEAHEPQPEQPQPPREEAVPDGKHSWMVAVAAAWNVFCCSLLRRAMPVMFLAVGDAFATTSKGPSNKYGRIVSEDSWSTLATRDAPVATLLCRIMSLKLLSAGGALLIGVGQILCFFLGDLMIMVPVIGLCCGVGAALSMVVDEMAVCLHFKAGRHKALSFSHAAFALSAIVYPVVFMLLVNMFGLDGAMLVSGAVSFNALAGSLVMSRPPWMSPSDPLPSIHRPDGADLHPSAGEQGATKGDAVEASKMSMADHHTSVAAEGHSTAVNPAFPSGATSGATSVEPGTAAASAAHAEGTEQPAHEEAGSPKAAAPAGAVEAGH